MNGPEDDDNQLLNDVTEREQWDQWLAEDKEYLTWLDQFDAEERE
jgi:hypothetical protein